MNGAFYIGATGLRTEERALETVANNIANINTNGYKRAEARFSEMVTPTRGPTDENGDDIAPSDPVAGLSGVMVNSTRDFSQGPMQVTSAPLDLAINGDGFIELAGPSGQVLLTRGGSLQVNADGYLADPNGIPLKGMITIPTGLSNLSIGSDGKIQGQLAGQSQVTQLGQIDLVMVKDKSTLTALDGGLYKPANNNDLISVAPGDEGAGMLMQGQLEGSNVDLSDEMVNMLVMQRAYGANAQVVQAGDQLMSIANSLRR